MKRDKRQVSLNYFESYRFVHDLSTSGQNGWQVDINAEKGKIIIREKNGESAAEFKFPLVFPEISQGNTLCDYVNKIDLIPSKYLVILIQAGNCAMGYFCNDRLVDHKVIKKYMIRKKQGVAQINYLKRKGKSRLGSRIRLANTVSFFTEINEVLANWFRGNTINNIYFSCTPYIWGLVFRARVKTPFNKKDSRLKKIPFDVRIPNFKQLLYINKLILSGSLGILNDKYVNIMNQLKQDKRIWSSIER